MLHKTTGFVAFLDILGFKDLMQGHSATHDLREIVQILTDRIGTDAKLKPDLNYIFVSDTIVIFCEADMFSTLMKKICQIQNQILKLGFLTRGALTFGEIIYMLDYDEKSAKLKSRGINIFGKAYLEAYETHDKDAKYPRVLVSDSAIKRAKVDPFDKEISDYLVCRDRDGWNIISQFGRQLFRKLLYKNHVKLIRLEDLELSIKKGCKNSSKNARTREKWHWIRYHLKEERSRARKLFANENAV